MDAQPLTLVTSFRIKCQTQLGDRVVVVGDCPELGSWQPDAGLPLVTSASTYPVYTSGTVDLSSGFVSFKFVRMGADGSVHWEQGSNRCVVEPLRQFFPCHKP